MKALTTGGTGFVGRWLAAHLRECGDTVVATGEEVDVTVYDAVRAALDEHRPDVVYHLAGQSHVGRSWEQPSTTYAVNTLGTVNVLEAARATGHAVTVLVVSSAEVYGNVAPDDLPLVETSRTAPVSPYAGSKLAAEVAARQAARGHGQRVVIVRPFNHIGPAQSPTFVVSALAQRVALAERSGSREVRMGNPSARRDFTDVRDVVRAYRLLVERGASGETYNVCSGVDVPVGDLARQLIAMARTPVELVTDAVDLRPVDVPVLRGDSSKLRAATGWQPQIPLESTLRAVLDWWREHPEG